MTTGMSKEQIYEQAKKRVEAKKGFFIHLTVYIVVNIMLVLISARWNFSVSLGIRRPMLFEINFPRSYGLVC